MAAGLVLLSQYFDGTCDCKAAAAPIKVGQILDPECIAFVRRQPIFFGAAQSRRPNGYLSHVYCLSLVGSCPVTSIDINIPHIAYVLCRVLDCVIHVYIHVMPAKPAPAYIMSAMPKPLHVMSAKPEPVHIMLATQETFYNMATTQKSLRKLATSPESLRKMAASPESLYKMAATPESPAKMATTPESTAKIATTLGLATPWPPFQSLVMPWIPCKFRLRIFFAGAIVPN